MQVLPLTQCNEGINVVHRADFREWIEKEASGLLWIDGYEVPGQPSWTTEFALNIVRAALEAGYGVLYNFCTLYADTPSICNPRALVQRLSFHLLRRFPEVLTNGDPELFNAEIFVAAKSDMELSWKIFLECLRAVHLPVIYLVVEGIDRTRIPGVGEDFEKLLQRFKDLEDFGRAEQKKIKVILTSVRPDGGSELLFDRSRSKANKVGDNDLIIRIPRVAVRSRKQHALRPSKKTASAARCRAPMLDGDSCTDKVHEQYYDADDFIPSDTEKEQTAAQETTDVESDSDFDIFSDPGDRERSARAHFQNKTRPSVPAEESATQKSKLTFGNDAAMDSDSSFDIFESDSKPEGRKLARYQSSEFVPSSGED